MSRTVSFRPAAEWSTEQLRPVRQNDLELAGLPRISLVEFDHGALSDEACIQAQPFLLGRAKQLNCSNQNAFPEDVKVKRKLPLKSVRDRQQTSWEAISA